MEPRLKWKSLTTNPADRSVFVWLQISRPGS